MSERPINDFSQVSLKKRDKFESEIGYFTNTYNLEINQGVFIQDSISFIKNIGTVKGLHLQNSPFAQAKLVTVLSGGIIDYIVDLRPYSNTYLDYGKVIISEENKHILFIPRGFAHGYITSMENTMISYKVDNDYSPKHEIIINWQDETLGLKWPLHNQYFLSKKDEGAKKLNEIKLEIE
jgi:dTDP-4-dehydrorhamnose 3,5-epimerase